METKVNETINNICEWINKELKNASSSQTESILPEMINALSELIISHQEIY